MIKKLIAIFIACGLCLVALSANAAPKAKKYSPPSGLYSRCDYESGLRGDAKKVQQYLESQGRCIGAMRVVNSQESKTLPASAISKNSSMLTVEQCKLAQPTGNFEFRGFMSTPEEMYTKKRHPAAGSIIQVIGASGKDAPPGLKTPGEDYKFYLDFLRSWFNNVNNSSSPVTIRVSEKWYSYPGLLKPLELAHKNPGPGVNEFASEIIRQADADIDFSNVGYVLFVVPAGTRLDVASQSPLGLGKSNEGQLFNMSLAMPMTTDKSQSHMFSGFFSPLMFVHEIYHPGFNMGDQYGDQSWKFENRGMGMWGMFATGSSDMLQWQKWLLGFTTDSQVACAPLDTPTTTWLTPGSTKSSKTKLLVVPVSSTEVIVVESMRATGANYKLSKAEQGALVYTVNTSDMRHGFGYEVQIPYTRSYEPHRYAMGNAPFKKGEHFTYKGVKITNVEWGPFGDVIKVEPAR